MALDLSNDNTFTVYQIIVEWTKFRTLVFLFNFNVCLFSCIVCLYCYMCY